MLGCALFVGCGGETSVTPDAAAPAVTVPSAVAARVSVRFELRGASGFAVIRGRSCATFEIEREGDGGFERVPLDLGASCVCECPAPGEPLAIGLTPLSSPTPYNLLWDGRQMVSVVRTIDCATRSFSVRGPAMERVGALQPLPAGRYRVSIAVIDTVPPGCQKLMEGYWCPPMSTSGAPAPGAYALCPGRRVSATFDLPESGELVVPVGAP